MRKVLLLLIVDYYDTDNKGFSLSTLVYYIAIELRIVKLKSATETEDC